MNRLEVYLLATVLFWAAWVYLTPVWRALDFGEGPPPPAPEALFGDERAEC